eukprot:NP_001269077.1 uncharacterized protein LOC101056408 [Mus musculus]
MASCPPEPRRSLSLLSSMGNVGGAWTGEHGWQGFGKHWLGHAQRCLSPPPSHSVPWNGWKFGLTIVPLQCLRTEAGNPSIHRLCSYLLGNNVALFICELFLRHLLSWNILKLIPLELEEGKDPDCITMHEPQTVLWHPRSGPRYPAACLVLPSGRPVGGPPW